MAEKKKAANTGKLIDPLAKREKWIMPKPPKEKQKPKKGK